MVVIYGRMAVNMKDNIRMTRNMDRVHTYGLMVESMKEIGRMEDNTVVVNIYQNKVYQEKVFGIMVKEKNGLILRLIEI